MSYILIAIAILFLAFLSNGLKQNPDGPFGDISDHISIFHKGYSITGGMRSLPRILSERGILVVGPSGSGKTSSVCIASLFNLMRGNNSVILMDVGKSIYPLTSGYVSKRAKIHCIDLSETSDGFNPLLLCGKNIGLIQKVAHILIKNGGVESKHDLYWTASAQSLLSCMMEYVIFYTPPEYHHMVSVLQLIETFASEPQKIDILFSKVNEKLLRSYKTINAAGEKTIASTVSTALTALRAFRHPDVARITSYSTFDIKSFRSLKSVLYISLPLNLLSVLAPIAALLYESIFDEVLSRMPSATDNSIYCIIDEMATMRFQDLGIVWSNCRRFRSGMMGLIQDERMLEINMSVAEAHAIRSNSYTKIFLPGQPLATCKSLSELIGTTTMVDAKGIERTKIAMEPSAIRICKEAFIAIGAEKICKVKMIPFYEHSTFNARTKISPFQPEKKIPFDTPPQLQLF